MKPRAFPLLAFLLAASCGPAAGPPAPPSPPQVSISQPLRQDVVEWDEYPGRLEAVESVELRPLVSGHLQSIHFKDGAVVAKGDLLFTIDPRPYRAALDLAEAELGRMQARLELATADEARAERLFKAKVGSAEEFETRAKGRQEAEAALRSARAAVDAAALNLEFTRVSAPIAGRMGRRLVTPGNLVGPATLLATVVSQDPVYAYFDVDERSFLRYRAAGDEPPRVALSLPGEDGFAHEGRLDFFDNRVDRTTGTIRGRGVFPNPEGRLVPGLYARVRVSAGAAQKALLVADAAFGADQDRRYVLVVGDAGDVEYRAVATGPLVHGCRVVRQGLKPDDWVVTSGLLHARPGMKVACRKVEMPRLVAGGR